MEIVDLVKFGMTKTEAKVYLELLKIGGTKIGELIRRTGIHRGTVYNSLNDLIKKGFVSFIDKDRVRYYNSSGVNIFKQILESEEERIKKEKIKIKDLEIINPLISEESNVKVLIGKKAFKSFFSSLYDWAYKTKQPYYFIGKGGEMIDVFGLGYYKGTQELKKKLKLRCKVILNETGRSIKNYLVAGDVRYLPDTYLFPISAWIYGNKVCLVVWETEPKTIIIESQKVAENYVSYFEALWKISKS